MVLLNMDILEVTDNKEQYMDLLMLTNEKESTIESYLKRGALFALYDDYDLKTAAVVTKESEDTYEIKNLATLKIYQGKGYGSSMIKHIIQHYKSKCKSLVVGAGENEKTLIFYEKLGFTYFNAVNNIIFMKYKYS